MSTTVQAEASKGINLHEYHMYIFIHVRNNSIPNYKLLSSKFFK